MPDLVDAEPRGLNAAAALFGCHAEETDLTLLHRGTVLEAPLPLFAQKIE